MIRPSRFRLNAILQRRWNSKLVPKDSPNLPKNQAAPPPLDVQISSKLDQNTPKFTKQRISYKHSKPPKPSETYSPPSSRAYIWKKILPGLILLGGGIWILFTYDYLSKKEEETEILHPEKFTKWIITYRYELPDCPDHYIVELTKKNFQKLRSSVASDSKSLWNGHHSWSVEICQPEINIVRSYTPLPLYVGGFDPETKLPFLKLIDSPDEEGKFILYIKKYEQGEMARWISRKPLFSELLLRGPFEDFKLPYSPIDELQERETLKNVPSKIDLELRVNGIVKPDNLVFYVAGTGITPALQMLYSRNPPRGFVDVHWSLNDRKELLKSFEDLNFFLEKLGRARFHYYIANERKHLSKKDIPAPGSKSYQGFKSLEVILNKEKQDKIAEINANSLLEQSEKEKLISEITQDPNDMLYRPDLYKNQLEQFAAIKDKLKLSNPALAIVCGPEGYLKYVCGAKNLNNVENIDVAPISGLLAAKGWDKSNVIRM